MTSSTPTTTTTTTTTTSTQILIIGGGLTGLTLALMLERLQIPYLLLEAYPTLTPSVGTALGLFANGLRIMDQLGLLEEIEATAQRLLRQEIIDGQTGAKVWDMDVAALAELMEQRHGYVTTTLARHELLAILHRNVRRKERLLTGKRVARVEQDERGARVLCEDGSTYAGQVVVGADGVHSAVRSEMWRMAKEMDPGWMPEDRTMRCEFALVFAICHNPAHPFAAGDVIGIQRPCSNAGVLVGRSRELFLFYYWRLRPPHDSFPADAIPRVSAEEQERRWAEAAALPLNRGGMAVFGDLWKKGGSGLERRGATVLPHHAFGKWWQGRCVVIGDAAHKFNPLMGQGGNSCIESCAALVSQLERCLGEERGVKLQEDGRMWPADALEEVFREVQEMRLPRVRKLIEKSQKAQYMAAWENRLYECLAKYVMPRLPSTVHASLFSSYVVGCSRLKGKAWDRPDKKHSIPWGDEVQKKGLIGPMRAMVVLLGVTTGVWMGRSLI